jgi:signal transduction histidine kinase
MSPPRPAATANRVVDAALASGVLVLGLLEIWVPLSSRQGSGSEFVSSVLVLASAAGVALRRVRPLVVALPVFALFVAGTASGLLYVLFWGSFLPFEMLVFTLARHGRRREPLWGAVAAAASLVLLDLTTPSLQQPGEIAFHWLVTLLAFGAGWTVRTWEHRADVSRRRAIEAEVSAARREAAAVIDERTRIARELHDVVAHAVSTIVVQAGAAEQVVSEDPDHVRTTLETIRVTGVEALAEMRRMVLVLRDPEEDAALAPQPGVAAIPQLVEEVRAAGLDVALATYGEQRPLPAGLDLAAYRIVQEALTNVRKHAHATSAQVTLRYAMTELTVEVADDGRGVTDSPAGAGSNGHGLLGMRERTAAYGGRLETESRPSAGFTVRAVFQTDST